MADEDREQHLVDDEYVVETGYHTARDPDGSVRKCGPGDRFRPTVKQAQDGSLEGKARPVTGADHTLHSGADIGLRALPITDAALRLALDAELDEADFEDLEPETGAGNYSKAQVKHLIAARRGGEEADEDEAPEAEADEDEGPTSLPDDFPHAETLREAGLETVEAVAEVDDLTEISGIGQARAEEISEALEGG